MAERYGIYQALHEDHERIVDLLGKVTQPPDGKDIDKLFAEVQLMLTQHERAEETCFYQPLLRPATTHKDALLGYEEHHVGDLIMGELAEGDPADERWQAKAEVLKETVEHHIEEEEGRVFEHARQAMSQDWAEQQAKLFLSEKQRLQSQTQRQA